MTTRPDGGTADGLAGEATALTPEFAAAAAHPDATDRNLQTAAIRGSWWTAVQSLALLPISFVANIVVARALSSGEYGQLASYLAAFGLTVALAGGAVNEATVQWASAAWARGRPEEMLEILRRTSGYHLAVKAPAVGIGVLVIVRHESTPVIVVAVFAAVASMVVDTAWVAVATINRTALLAKINFGSGLVQQAAVICAAAVTHDAALVWIARLAVSVLNPLLALVLAPADLRRATLVPAWPAHWPEGFVRYCVGTLAGLLVATLVATRTEVFVLLAYGQDDAAGVFALASGLAVHVTVAVDSMTGPLVPAVAALMTRGRERVQAAAARGLRVSTALTAPVAAVVVPAVTALVPLVYGSSFSGAASLFVPLAVMSCAVSALNPISALSTAVRRPWTLMGLSGVALAVDVIVAVALVPVWGAKAAVAANVTAQATSLVLTTVVVCRVAELDGAVVRPVLVRMAAVLGAGAVGGVCTLVLAGRGSGAVVAGAVGVVVASGAATVLIRALGGMVTADDLAAVRAAVPRLGRPVEGAMRRLRWVRPG